jgi:hypothetical protein
LRAIEASWLFEIRFEDAADASLHSVASDHQPFTFVDTLVAEKMPVKLHCPKM